MGRLIFGISVATASLIAVSTFARAEVITYQCSDAFSTANYRVDTKTHSVLWSASDGQARGTVQVNGTTFVLTFTSPRLRTMTIDRKTGEASDTDGDSGTCQLVK